MVRKLGVMVALFGFLFLLNGCATGRKQSDLETQGLKNQVSVLESQVQSKDQEISSLKEALNKSEEEKAGVSKSVSGAKSIPEAKSHPSAKLIQQALKNAGYNISVIDGKMGRGTRDAIKAFQKANNLHADGRVGKKTWALLKEYLEKKVK